MPHELVTIAFSHYCEKARWALDVLGVDYALEYPLLGEHMALAQSWGLASSSMPMVRFHKSTWMPVFGKKDPSVIGSRPGASFRPRQPRSGGRR